MESQAEFGSPKLTESYAETEKEADGNIHGYGENPQSWVNQDGWSPELQEVGKKASDSGNIYHTREKYQKTNHTKFVLSEFVLYFHGAFFKRN